MGLVVLNPVDSIFGGPAPASPLGSMTAAAPGGLDFAAALLAAFDGPAVVSPPVAGRAWVGGNGQSGDQSADDGDLAHVHDDSVQAGVRHGKKASDDAAFLAGAAAFAVAPLAAAVLTAAAATNRGEPSVAPRAPDAGGEAVQRPALANEVMSVEAVSGSTALVVPEARGETVVVATAQTALPSEPDAVVASTVANVGQPEAGSLPEPAVPMEGAIDTELRTDVTPVGEAVEPAYDPVPEEPPPAPEASPGETPPAIETEDSVVRFVGNADKDDHGENGARERRGVPRASAPGIAHAADRSAVAQLRTGSLTTGSEDSPGPPHERGTPTASATAIAHASEQSAVAQLRTPVADLPPSDAPTAAQAPVEQPPAVEQVARAVIEKVGDGGGEARIQLDPPDLGEVTIHVKIAGDRVQVDVHAERPEAMQLLRQHTADLSSLLGQRGLDLADVYVGLGGRQAGGTASGGSWPGGREGESGEFAAIFGIDEPAAIDQHNRLRAAYNPDGVYVYRV